MLADARQINEPVDRSQQMICRHVPFKVEAVKQCFLRHRSLAHHRPVSVLQKQ
jgi:hypothetical protein